MPDRNTIAVSMPATVAGNTFTMGPVRLMGWSLKETTGAATAAFELYDGNDVTGQSLAPVTLQANESIRDWFGATGIICERGLFINVTSGSVRGTLFMKLLQPDAIADEQQSTDEL